MGVPGMELPAAKGASRELRGFSTGLGAGGPWNQPSDLWRGLVDLSLAEEGHRWVVGGLTPEKVPRGPTLLLQLPCPIQQTLPWRQRGDLAVPQLECRVCACSWRPCAGQSAPPVPFLGPGVGETGGDRGASPWAGCPAACWDKGHPCEGGKPKAWLGGLGDYHRRFPLEPPVTELGLRGGRLPEFQPDLSSAQENENLGIWREGSSSLSPTEVREEELTSFKIQIILMIWGQRKEKVVSGQPSPRPTQPHSVGLPVAPGHTEPSVPTAGMLGPG